MPQLDVQAWTHLWLLLLIVPIQYYFTNYYGSTESQRVTIIHKVVKQATHIKDNYFSLQRWQSWCQSLLSHPFFTGDDVDPADDRGESPAVEVLTMEDKHGYFASSIEVRSPRPLHLKFRVGQVITHKLWGYRGVIVGWDETAKAPERWLKQMHPADKAHWAKQPNYSILVDTRDRLEPQATYVPQENIEAVVNTQVMHPNVDSYFEIYDGAQYVPRPWLQSIYPHD